MSRPLIILGTGGGSHDVLDIVDALNALSAGWDVLGFLDDRLPVGGTHLGFNVLGPLRAASNFRDVAFVNAIGSETSFRRLPAIIASCGIARDGFATLVHPGAFVSKRAAVGRGVVVNCGVTIGGGAGIGDFVTLAPGSIIGHDAVIGPYSIIAPAAVVSGHVRIATGCYLGAGCTVKQDVALDEGSLVGMGAVVVRSVARCTTVVGNPAAEYVRRPNQTPYDRSSVGESRAPDHADASSVPSQCRAFEGNL